MKYMNMEFFPKLQTYECVLKPDGNRINNLFIQGLIWTNTRNILPDSFNRVCNKYYMGNGNNYTNSPPRASNPASLDGQIWRNINLYKFIVLHMVLELTYSFRSNVLLIIFYEFLERRKFLNM